jgi:hypothetical protein
LWKKVVQQVQTSVCFFHIHVCQQSTHRGIVDIRYGWRVLAPEKHIATATTIACIFQIILDVHNVLSFVQKGARTTILLYMNLLCSCPAQPPWECSIGNQNKVASEGLYNAPPTLVQSMQILQHSCCIMSQQLSLVEAQYLLYLGS